MELVNSGIASQVERGTCSPVDGSHAVASIYVQAFRKAGIDGDAGGESQRFYLKDLTCSASLVTPHVIYTCHVTTKWQADCVN